MSSAAETESGRSFRDNRGPAPSSAGSAGPLNAAERSRTRAPRPESPETARAPAYAAEQSVIGALLLDGKWSDVVDVVHPMDYASAHRPILLAIASLAGEGKPHDAVMVSQLLERNEHLGVVGGLAYISELARNTPTAANLVAYAREVRAQALRRHLGELLTTPRLDTPTLITELERDVAQLKGLLPSDAVVDAHQPLELESAAEWARRPEPAPRDWVIEGLIPGARVTSFLGNGGLGKTIIAGQIGVHVATGRRLFGLNVCGGPVLGIFCEDERDELERRIRAASAGEKLDLAALERLYPCSRDGMNNLLCTFDRDQIVLTPFYHQLEATVAHLRPRLLILDTAADLFAGDYVSTPHVRQFIKVALGRLCIQHSCAVLLLAHPSAAGLNSGDGGGFSTAWNNSVRSRLYLRRPKSDDQDAVQDRRILEVKKANYAADGLAIPLLYQGGYFVPDPDPLKESIKATRAPRVSTKLATATLQVLREKGRSGAVVSFGDLFEPLKAAGELPQGEYEVVRKPLQRALEQLKTEGLIALSKVPRGYRVVSELQ
jgi:RecA-family ATPase